jgi:heme/copper-type cytochrome/quinol oxidase subunit 1
MFGRLLDEKLGRWHFWGSFFGTIMTMTPLFILTDMPRRVYVYEETSWGIYHQWATVGAIIVFISQLLFLYNLVQSYSHGKKPGSNPWGASTLEWS